MSHFLSYTAAALYIYKTINYPEMFKTIRMYLKLKYSVSEPAIECEKKLFLTDMYRRYLTDTRRK